MDSHSSFKHVDTYVFSYTRERKHMEMHVLVDSETFLLLYILLFFRVLSLADKIGPVLCLELLLLTRCSAVLALGETIFDGRQCCVMKTFKLDLRDGKVDYCT